MPSDRISLGALEVLQNGHRICHLGLGALEVLQNGHSYLSFRQLNDQHSQTVQALKPRTNSEEFDLDTCAVPIRVRPSSLHPTVSVAAQRAVEREASKGIHRQQDGAREGVDPERLGLDGGQLRGEWPESWSQVFSKWRTNSYGHFVHEQLR